VDPRSVGDIDTTFAVPTDLASKVPDSLDAPQIQGTGGCSGVKITWSAIDGAERYFIVEDGMAFRTTTATQLTFVPFPDGLSHEYRVRARSGAVESELSNAFVVDACSVNP
jgi:hypothetical protein